MQIRPQLVVGRRLSMLGLPRLVGKIMSNTGIPHPLHPKRSQRARARATGSTSPPVTVVGASPTLPGVLHGVVRGVVVCDRRGRAPVRPGGMGATADATHTAAAGVDGRCMAQPSPEAPAIVAPVAPGAAPPAPLTTLQR